MSKGFRNARARSDYGLSRGGCFIIANVLNWAFKGITVVGYGSNLQLMPKEL